MSMSNEAPLGRRSRTKLSDAIVSELEQEILSGRYHEGDRLPTVAALCERYGVSRSVIRDALRTLSSLGLVRVRHGHGIEVGTYFGGGVPHAVSLMLQRSDLSMGDVLDARMHLEMALVSEAATAATSEDRKVMQEALERYEGHVSARQWLEAQVAHYDFHVAIARCVHLPALELMLSPLQEIVLITSLPITVDDPKSWGTELHRGILDALTSRSPRAARRAMSAHFAGRSDLAEFRAMKFGEARASESYQRLKDGIWQQINTR